ncbi:MAG: hypothetical protein ACK52R_03790, partial [Betaproteobacteria bacterium]
MSAFTELWSQLKQPGQPAPYMLIDCAGVEGGAERLPRDIFDEFECLFTGDLAEELEDVAPYLGRLASLGPEAQAVVEDLKKRAAMIWDSSPEAVEWKDGDAVPAGAHAGGFDPLPLAA